ncbi:hypothetical protein JOM56_007153 [Amanita muscaria]
MSSASKLTFPGTGQKLAGTSTRTSTTTEPAPVTSSTDRNRIEARAGHGKIKTLNDYRTTSNLSTSDRDAPLPKSPGQGAAEMSNGSDDKAARKSLTSYILFWANTRRRLAFEMRFNLNIGEQFGNFNLGNRQRNGGGVYKIVEKESSGKNETSTQKGARAADTPDKTERQEPASGEGQPTIKLGKLQGNFNYGDDQVNEGGKYELRTQS